MSDNNTPLKQLYNTFFSKHWPVWVGGVLVGLLNVFLFAIKSPWGASGGFNNWGENVMGGLGLMNIENISPVNTNLYGMLIVFIVVGSFIGALLSKEFALRVPPVGEMIKGLIGGGLMGIGAMVGIGCSIGSFFSGVPALSGGALVFTAMMFLGVLVALKYLMWEMEKFPGWSSGKSYTVLSADSKKGGWQRWIGWIVAIGSFVLAYFTAGANGVMAWFIIIGLLFGLISQRSRFCIVKSFRDPFMSGESKGSVGVIAGLLVGLVGFTMIKYFGISASGDALRAREMTWVFPHFWARAGIGGFIFGIGMTIAGGCAVGTLWRMGEGQVKLWASGLGFVICAPIGKHIVAPMIESVLPASAKFKSYLPDYFGYTGSFLIILGILLLWYVFVKWNEKTGRFSAY